MSCIIYQINKKTGVKYAYRSESYRDPETKKPKSKRTYIGRVDPVTGDIIPKAESGKRNRSSATGDAIPVTIQDELSNKRDAIRSLEKRVKKLEATLRTLKSTIEDAIAAPPDQNP